MTSTVPGTDRTLDEILAPEKRALAAELVTDGLAVAETLAAWVRRARVVFWYELPIDRTAEIMSATGLDAFDEVYALLACLAAVPFCANRDPWDLVDAFPEFGDVLRV